MKKLVNFLKILSDSEYSRKLREKKLKEVQSDIRNITKENEEYEALINKIHQEVIDKGSGYERQRNQGRWDDIRHNLKLIKNLEKDKNSLRKKISYSHIALEQILASSVIVSLIYSIILLFLWMQLSWMHWKLILTFFLPSLLLIIFSLLLLGVNWKLLDLKKSRKQKKKKVLTPRLIQRCELASGQFYYENMGMSEFEGCSQAESLRQIFTQGLTTDSALIEVEGNEIEIYMVAGQDFPFRDYREHLQFLANEFRHYPEPTHLFQVIQQKFVPDNHAKNFYHTNVWFDFQNNVLWTLSTENRDQLIQALEVFKEEWIQNSADSGVHA